MFNVETVKHENEIALSFHIGYQPQHKILLIVISFYKYSIQIEGGSDV
jgi:hypothetical protein